MEKHYSISQISELWGLSYDTVKRIFDKEPGVMKIGAGTRLVGRKVYRRRYFTLRVPEGVVRRVQARFSSPGAGAAQ